MILAHPSIIRASWGSKRRLFPWFIIIQQLPEEELAIVISR
jgi:hypothetical protein